MSFLTWERSTLAKSGSFWNEPFYFTFVVNNYFRNHSVLRTICEFKGDCGHSGGKLESRRGILQIRLAAAARFANLSIDCALFSK